MSTFEAFAQALAERAQHLLTFGELTALVNNRFADIGPIPSEGNRNAALRTIASVLPRVREPFNLGRVILFAGYLAECGATAAEVAPMVAERLPKLLSMATVAVTTGPQDQPVAAVAAAASKAYPDAASALLGTEPALTGAMCLFCKERAALRIARKEQMLLQDARLLERYVPQARLFGDLLDSSDRLPIVAICPRLERGFMLMADDVRNGFHLFVLLEGVLVGTEGRGAISGAPVPQEDLEIAGGRKPLEGEHTMHARFDYFNWSAWEGSNFAEDAPSRWIWGELSLKYIPQVDQQAIVLVETARYVRSWDATLACALHPEQRPNVNIDAELSREEVARWLQVFASAPAAVRARLRYAGVKLD